MPEVAGRPILEGVKDHLRDKELLLIVDNFEQVAAAGPVIEELLTAAAEAEGRGDLPLRAVAAGRAGVRGAAARPARSRAAPRPVRRSRRVEAVRLFTERAEAVGPRFRVTEENAAAVAEITARLDGLPLAIELAATRAKLLSPQQMLDRLVRA